MDQHNLDNLVRELKIASVNILREEAEMLLLYEISQSAISKHLIFYGGTALRLAYNCPRFSEDLDFLMAAPISEKQLELVLGKACKSDPNLEMVDIKEKYHTLFGLIKVKHPLLKHPFSIKIEISKRKNGIDKEFRPLNSPTSTLQPLLFVATLSSLYAAKQKAMADRNVSRDWFDFWYISKLLRENPKITKKSQLNKTEFEREMKRFLPKDKWLLIKQAAKDIGL